MIPNFPLWTLSDSSTFNDGAHEGSSLIPGWPYARQYEGGRLVAVCSHDCDLENPRARTGVLLAPLVKIPASKGSLRYEEILASDSLADESWNYINLFPVVLPESLALDPMVIDMSALTTMASALAAISLLHESRIVAMTDETRTKFKRKLGALFARP